MTEFERITADQMEPGDYVASTRNHPPVLVEAIESIGASSRYIRLAGNDRIRPRHTTKFWRVVRSAESIVVDPLDDEAMSS